MSRDRAWNLLSLLLSAIAVSWTFWMHYRGC